MINIEPQLLRLCKMHCNTDKAELYDKVNYIRSIFSLSLDSYPINLFDCVASIPNQIILKETSLQSAFIGGFTIRSNEPDMPSLIVMNRNSTAADRNFALAHELIHFFCHEYANGGYYSAKNEVQANEGAAELLLPYKLFIPDVQAGIDVYGNLDDAIINTAKAYKVAPDVAKYRYLNLKAEREQFFSGVPLDDIKIMKRSEWKALQE